MGRRQAGARVPLLDGPAHGSPPGQRFRPRVRPTGAGAAATRTRAADPSEPDARKGLLLQAAKAMGVATPRDLAQYHRQKIPVVKPLVAELAEDGALVPVQVESWRETAWLHPEAAMPRRVNAAALLSPFDSLCWERDRVERVFGFHYRIEIYVPQPKRQYGYYVLPFLFGDQLVARVDLKADRANRTLLAQGVFGESGIPTGAVAATLAPRAAGIGRLARTRARGDRQPGRSRRSGAGRAQWRRCVRRAARVGRAGRAGRVGRVG